MLHQQKLGEPFVRFDRGEQYRNLGLLHRLDIDHDQLWTALTIEPRVLRVGVRRGGDLRQPDDRLVIAGVVHQHLVALFRLPKKVDRLRVGDAVPARGLLAQQVIKGIRRRLGLEEVGGHACIVRGGYRRVAV